MYHMSILGYVNLRIEITDQPCLCRFVNNNYLSPHFFFSSWQIVFSLCYFITFSCERAVAAFVCNCFVVLYIHLNRAISFVYYYRR